MKWTHAILTALIMLCGSGIYAQARLYKASASIYVDPVTYLNSGIAPYDLDNWYYYFPIDSNLSVADVNGIDVMRTREINGKGSSEIVYAKDKQPQFYFRYYSTMEQASPDEKNIGLVKKNCVDTAYPGPGPYRYLKIRMMQVPSKAMFKVVISINAGKYAYDGLHKFNLKGNMNEDEYKQVCQSIRADQEMSIGFPSFWDYKTFYDTKLKEHYSMIRSDTPALYLKLLPLLATLRDTMRIDTIITARVVRAATKTRKAIIAHDTIFKVHRLSEYIRECLCQGTVNKIIRDSVAYYNTYIPYLNIFAGDQDALMLSRGQLSALDAPAGDTADISAVSARVANLKLLAQSLKSIHLYLMGSCCRELISDTQRRKATVLIAGLSGDIAAYAKKLTTADAKIKTLIYAREDIFVAKSGEGSTSISSQDVHATAGNYLIPDIGVISVFSIARGAFPNDYQFRCVVRPYWGLNISWVPINKNIPIRNIRHYKALHCFSTTIGLTAVPLNIARASDLIKGVSLLTGIGIRPFRWGRFTIGTLMYQVSNANPAKAPAITFAPVVGFSVDMDVVSWAQMLQSKIF